LGWLDKIFGKKEEEKFEDTKMSLKDVEDFLTNELKKKFEPLKDSAKKENSNLLAIANNLQEQLKVLENAPYSTNNEPIIIMKAVGSRKSFIEKMKSLVKQVKKPMSDNMDSIVDFHNETAQMINVTNEHAVKEYVFMKELFEKEADKAIDCFRELVEADKRLGNVIKEFKESNLLRAQEIVVEILKLAEEIKNENKTGELDKRLKEMTDKNNKIGNELKKLLDSNEWKEFLNMEKVKDDIKANLQNKKYQFIQSVSEVENPLKKYKWSVKNKILDDYVQHSFEAILSEDPKGEVFLSAIKDIKKKITEGEIELKNIEKVLPAIEKMIEENTIGKILEEYSKLSEELREQEEKISLEEISRKKSDLEREIIELKREMEEVESEKNRIEERRKRMGAEKDQKLKELENLTSVIAGKRISLKIN